MQALQVQGHKLQPFNIPQTNTKQKLTAYPRHELFGCCAIAARGAVREKVVCLQQSSKETLEVRRSTAHVQYCSKHKKLTANLTNGVSYKFAVQQLASSPVTEHRDHGASGAVERRADFSCPVMAARKDDTLASVVAI